MKDLYCSTFGNVRNNNKNLINNNNKKIKKKLKEQLREQLEIEDKIHFLLFKQEIEYLFNSLNIDDIYKADFLLTKEIEKNNFYYSCFINGITLNKQSKNFKNIFKTILEKYYQVKEYYLGHQYFELKEEIINKCKIKEVLKETTKTKKVSI